MTVSFNPDNQFILRTYPEKDTWGSDAVVWNLEPMAREVDGYTRDEPLRKIRIRLQSEAAYDQPYSYGINTGRIESMEQCAAALALYKRVDRAIQQHTKRFGAVTDFRTWFVLVCEALGIEEVRVPSKWDPQGQLFNAPADAASAIAYRMRAQARKEDAA